MDFNEWLAANGFDPNTVTAAQKRKLEAAWRAEQNPPTPPPSPPSPAPTPHVNMPKSSYEEFKAANEAEAARVEHIQQAVQAACERYPANPAQRRALQAMGDAAIADKSVTTQKFDLDLIRADRNVGPMIISGSSAAPASEAVVEAAVAKCAGLQSLEKEYDARTLEAADKHFRHGLGLQDLLGLGARQNGWRGASVKAALSSKDFWRAAFGQDGGPLDLRAGVAGPSTYSIPTIVSNVANKFLRVGFMAVDATWSRISSRRAVNDFKQAKTAALTGALQYVKLAPSGEITHGSVGETTYTNQADTYAIMLGIARTDLINDDLGALSTAGQRLGRGAGLKINDVFWTVFLNNSSFFTSGNNNTSTGAGSALGTADGAAINAAEVKFLNQTDPDGKPIAVQPRILLAPPTLRNTAARWMGSQLFVGSTGLGDGNIFGGRYTVESAPYMENTSYTGNSTAAWYLLADPMDMPVIEVAFVAGKDTPTVDTAEADFNQLGIAMRGYIDFGVSLQEFRGGVRSAGS